jgi:hypothetical protein
MPRVGEPIPRGTGFYPWAEWEEQLKKAPTGTLYFSNPEDFQVTKKAFIDQVRKRWSHLNVIASQRGEEVMVSLA